MANLIQYNQNAETAISCSNGTTTVLLTLIGLSGSRLAEADCEKQMIV